MPPSILSCLCWAIVAVFFAGATSAAPRCGDASYCKESCAKAYPWPIESSADRQHCRTKCTKCGQVRSYKSGDLVLYAVRAGAKIKLDTLVGTATGKYCVRVTSFGADGKPDGLNSGRIYSNVVGLGWGQEVQVNGSKCLEQKPFAGAATVKYAANSSALSILVVASTADAVEMLRIGLEDGTVQFSVPKESMTPGDALLLFLRETYERWFGNIAR